MCWYNAITSFSTPCDGPPPVQLPFKGFPLNLDLWYGPVMGDYPPRSLELERSSSPMIARRVAHHLGPVPFTSRPMLGEALDLITGSPLLQEIDLELPFGSAVYRHVRTYSEPTSMGVHEQACLPTHAGASSMYWDWHGQGWMMGENPMLLIDAAYWGWSDNPKERRCYFIPDAHHAIPFIMQEFPLPGAKPVYVAPPRFDAVLSYEGGEWDVPNERWSVPPTTWYVWMHGGAVKYTFKPRYEDVGYTNIGGSPGWRSHHEAPDYALSLPQQGGSGIPYYGLATRIEDRFGNRIDINYCEFRQHDCGGALGCQFCCQNCYEKGQVRSVKLYPAGAEVAAWTLVFVHRGFSQDTPYYREPGTIEMQYPHHRQQAVHTIYAFRSDLDIEASSPTCLTLPYALFENTVNQFLPSEGDPSFVHARIALNAIQYIDPFLELPPGTLPGEWADQWEYRLHYTYTDRSWVFSPRGTYDPRDVFGGGLDQPIESPRLVKASVYHRLAAVGAQPATEVASHRLYRHRNYYLVEARAEDPIHMEYTWGPNQLAAIRAGIEAFPGANEDLLADWPIGLLTTVNEADFRMPNTPSPYNYSSSLWKTAKFSELAALSFNRWGSPPGGLYGNYGGAMGSCFMNEAVGDFVQSIADKSKLLGLPTGVSVFADRQSGDGAGAFHKVYRFLVIPPDPISAVHVGVEMQPSGCDSQAVGFWAWVNGAAVHAYRGIIHHPYLFNYASEPGNGGQTVASQDIVGPGEPLWMTIVDTYDTEFAMRPQLPPFPEFQEFPFDGLYYPQLADMPAHDPRLPLSRRVVLMNAAGYVIDEGTWLIKGHRNPTGGYGNGVRSLYMYDDQQRLEEIRTPSWRAAESTVGGAGEGLIHVYRYDDRVDANNQPVYAKGIGAVGLKRGTSGTVHWTNQYFHRNPDRPELVTHEVVYHAPPTGTDPPTFSTPPAPADPSCSVTVTEYDLVQPPGTTEPGDKRVVKTTRVLPPVAPSPSATPAYPISTEGFDDKGRLRWRAYGSAVGYGTPGQSWSELYLDRLDYNEHGLLIEEGIDVVVAQDPNGAYPAPPTRVAPQAALNQVTSYQYSGERVSRIDFPNGRSQFHRYLTWSLGSSFGIPQEYYEERVYKDMIESGGVWRPMGPGTVIRRNIVPSESGNGGPLINSTLLVQWPDITGAPVGDETYTPLLELEPEYNGAGSLTKWTVSGSDQESISGTVTTTRLGEIERVRGPDGTITRTVSDGIGRTLKVFKGTHDLHPYWRTVAPDVNSAGYNDNMVLLEKRYYGTGVEDYNPASAIAFDFGNAGKVVEVRRYRQRFADQYPLTTTPTPYQEDQLGWAEEHRFDWRGRDVWTLLYETGPTSISVASTQANPAVLRHSMVWLDDHDRVRFAATFDDTATATLEAWAGNATVLGPGQALPTPREIIEAGAVRLTETVYNIRGLVEQTREYDCGWEYSAGHPAPPCLLSETYYDFRSKPAYVRSPGSGVQLYTYNARGYQIGVASGTLDSGSQLIQSTRTDTTQISPEGNAEVTVHWERRHDGTGATLDGSNAVASYTYNWFDPKNRLVASASVGTGVATFVNSTPPTRPSLSPARADSSGDFAAFDWDASTTTVDPPPAGVAISGEFFNIRDEKAWTVSPSGAVTAFVYNSLGAVTRTSENAQSFNRRVTASKYANGKLIKMAAITNPDIDPAWETGIGAQVTGVVHGAAIFDEATGMQISENGGMVAEVHFPDRTTGAPAANDSGFVFTYYPDGLLRSRTDGRGIKFVHKYDELGNLVRTDVDYTNAQYPLNIQPVDRIIRVDYQHAPATGELLRVTTWTTDGSSALVPVTDNVYSYDSRGNLIREVQSHGELAHAQSPAIDYSWHYSPANGSVAGSIPGGHDFSRLASMLYPVKPVAQTRRLIELHAGDDAGSPDSILNRVTSVTGTESGQSSTIAEYAYTGGSRRVSRNLGRISAGVFAAAQTFAGGTGYAGLDGHGRPLDLHYESPSGTLQRFEHGYDAGGLRLWTKLTQRAPAGGHWTNERSWRFGYDGLNRLTLAHAGALDTSHQVQASNLLPNPRLESWTMDSLGNWVGNGTAFGHELAGPQTRRVNHQTNRVNETTRLITDSGPSTSQAQADVVHDRSGNLVSDSAYFFQYDAWNRLVSVRHRGSLDFSATGDVEAGEPGPQISQFTYDGLGRVVRKLSPYPGYAGQWRTEHYYYDGVRRIQEVFSDPISSNSPFTSQEEVSELSPATWCDREYVWDASRGAYVDECLVQYDGWGRAAYVLQDANFNVVGLVEPDGDPILQYGWTPYGEVLFREVFSGAFSDNRLGHQGLFFDRIDAGCLSVQLEPTVLSATPHRGLYQNRNRTYDPGLGRFLQRDPNGAGLTTLDHPPFEDGAFFVSIGAPDVNEHFADGLSSYAYLRQSPSTGLDPQGMFVGIVGMGLGSTMSTDIYLDYNDEATGAGLSFLSFISETMFSYAFEQSLDLNWASDWSEDDGLYHGSADWSSGTGAYAGIATEDRFAGDSDPALAGRGTPRPPSWLKKLTRATSGPGVYMLVNQETGEVYVGRSKNVSRRMREHLKSTFANVDPSKITSVAYAVRGSSARRGVEQKLIEAMQNGKLLNKINGISGRNSNINNYMRAFNRLLKGL